MAAAPQAQSPRAADEMLRRIARFSGLYGVGFVITAVLGLVALALFTRALEPAEYGQLAVLLFFSGTLTILINLATLPGTMSWVFGGAGEDGVEIDDDAEPGAADPQRAAATGLALTVLAGVVAMAIVFLLRAPLRELFAIGRAGTDLVLLAAAAAIPASVVRLLANLLRYGQRPMAYVSADNARPLLLVGGAAVVLAAGAGVRAALIAYLVAGWGAVALAALLMRHDLRPAVSRGDARMIVRRGLPVTPAALSNWVVLNGDVFMLSLYASNAQVGIYRVATTLGRLGSYAVSTFLRAWGPLTSTPLARAVEAQHGRGAVSARTLEFFVVGGCFVLVALAAFADVIVRIAPPDYGRAAPLVPLLAAVFVMRGVFIMSYHGSERQDRRRWMFSMFVVCAVIFVGASILIIPPLGATGAALAGVIAYAIGTVVMLVLALRGPDPMPLRWSRVLGALVLGGALYGAVSVASEWGPVAGYAVDVAAVVAFPLLAMALRIVPPELAAPILSAVRALIPARRAPAPVRLGLAGLDPHHVVLLERLVRRREKVERVAADLHDSEDALRLQLVVLLRRLSRLPAGVPLDPEMSKYILETDSVVHHVSLGKRLTEEGLDPYVIDALHQTATVIRRMPARSWRRRTAR